MATVKVTTDMNPEAASALFAWALATADIIINTPGEAGQSYKHRLGDLTPAGVHYLAGYGARESIRDSVSGVRKAVKEAAELLLRADKPDTRPWAKWVAESKVDPSTLPADDKTIEYVADAVITARQDARFAAIVASSIPVKDSAGRLSDRDRWIKAAALAEIKAICERKAKAMPEGDELRTKLAAYITAKAAAFDTLYAEHVARLAGAVDAADDLI